MKRQDENSQFWKRLMDSTGGLETIQVRHADVHHDDIWLELLGEGNRLSACLGFSANFPSGPRGEELFQAPANDVVIVCNENFHRVHPQSQRCHLELRRAVECARRMSLSI